jgi:hypothetical protein
MCVYRLIPLFLVATGLVSLLRSRNDITRKLLKDEKNDQRSYPIPHQGRSESPPGSVGIPTRVGRNLSVNNLRFSAKKQKLKKRLLESYDQRIYNGNSREILGRLPAIFPKSLPPDSQTLPEGLGYSRDIALMAKRGERR